MADPRIKAIITAEDRASGAISNVGKGLGRLGDIAKRVAQVGIAALGVGLVFSVREFIEAERQSAQLNAVLKSTGQVAGITAKRALELSKAFQRTTTFSDEEVLSAENLILTFTKINKDIFPETIQTVLDISTALGQDLKSSSIQVGKALQDPILGISALRRVGVNFSADQKEVVKNLVETGRTAEAQKLILKELATEFGGSSTEAAKTFGGQLKQLRNSLSEVAEDVGAFLVPKLLALRDSIVNTIEKMQAWWTIIRAKLDPAILELQRVWEMELLPALREFWAKHGPEIMNVLRELGKLFGSGLVVALMAFIKLLTLTFRGLSVAIRLFMALGNAIEYVSKSLRDLNRIPLKGLNIAGQMLRRRSGGPVRARGGLVTRVGEEGPENVILPSGSRVQRNIDSKLDQGASTVNFHVNIGMFAGTPAERRKLAQTIWKDLEDIASRHNQNAAQMLGA